MDGSAVRKELKIERRNRNFQRLHVKFLRTDVPIDQNTDTLPKN